MWLLHCIKHPLFLHGVFDWWEATTKTNHISKVSKINRCALMDATGAFKTTPTLALVYFLDVLLIKINAKQLETNSWNRFLGISIRVPPGCGHHELQNLLHATSKQNDQPADYIIKEISFPNLKMRFYTHPKIVFRTTLTFQVTTSVHTLTVYPMNLVWVFILKFKTKIHLFPYPAHPPYFRM